MNHVLPRSDNDDHAEQGFYCFICGKTCGWELPNPSDPGDCLILCAKHYNEELRRRAEDAERQKYLDDTEFYPGLR